MPLGLAPCAEVLVVAARAALVPLAVPGENRALRVTGAPRERQVVIFELENRSEKNP